MAGLHSGVFGEIKFDCRVCENNPKMSEAWGCIDEAKVTGPVLSEKENGVVYNYRRCPIKFIPKSVYLFMKTYNYHKRFPGAPMPSYSNVNPRFDQACGYYEAKLGEYTKEKLKNG